MQTPLFVFLVWISYLTAVEEHRGQGLTSHLAAVARMEGQVAQEPLGSLDEGRRPVDGEGLHRA